MKIPHWLVYAVLKAILWLGPLSLAAGLAISVWAWWASRKAGYLVFTIYFLLTAFHWASPPIINIITGKAPALTQQQVQAYTRELGAVDKKYFPSGHPIRQTIFFPLGQIVLVTGLWLVARRDVMRRAEPPAGDDPVQGGGGTTDRGDAPGQPLGHGARSQ